MQSSIKIDFRDNGDGKGLQPVISVRLISTDDPRDGLIQAFFQELGGASNWLRVTFDTGCVDSANEKFITIRPIRAEDLPATVTEISERIEAYKGIQN